MHERAPATNIYDISVGGAGIFWRAYRTAIPRMSIRNGVKIERHYYNPAQLKTDVPKGWENIDEAIDAAKKSREAQAAAPDAKENDTPGDYIEVWEVHGVLPKSYLEEKGEENEYERQMHVIVLDESKEGETSGVTLYMRRN